MDTTLIFVQARKYLFHHVTKNTAYQVLGKVVTALTTLFIVRLVTQYYGSNGAGELTLVLNYLNIFYLLADFGVNAIVVKLMVEQPDQESALYRTVLGLRLATSALLGLIAIVIASIFTQVLAKQNQLESMYFFKDISLLAITIVLQAIFLTANTVFQKRFLYDRSTIANAAGSIVGFVSFLLLARPGIPLIVPLTAYLFNYLATAGLAVYLLPFPLTEKVTAYFSFDQWKKILVPSLPIAGTLVLNVVYFKSDSFILASLKPLSDVGIYGVAYRIFEQGIVLPIFFVNALYPVLLDQITYHPKKLRRTLFVSSLILVGCGMALALVEIIFAPTLVAIVTSGKGFTDAILPLRILAAGLPFFFLSNLFLWLLVTLGQQKHLIVIYGTSMIFNIVLNLLLIPHYSYLAAAILTGASEAIVLALTMTFGLHFLNKKLTQVI